MDFLSLQAYHEIFPYSWLNEVTDFRVFFFFTSRIYSYLPPLMLSQNFGLSYERRFGIDSDAQDVVDIAHLRYIRGIPVSPFPYFSILCIFY